jgi:hypothetical protein
LLSELAKLRTRFEIGSDAERRLDDRRQREQELEQLALRAANLRNQLDTKVSNYAHDIAAPPLTQGKLLRIRLLLESPLVRPTTGKCSGGLSFGNPSAAAAGEDRRRQFARRRSAGNSANGLCALLRVFEPTAEGNPASVGPNIYAVLQERLDESRLPSVAAGRELTAWAPLARKLREFDEALPKYVESQWRSFPTVSNPTYYGCTSVFLVDGRDVRASRGSSAICFSHLP